MSADLTVLGRPDRLTPSAGRLVPPLRELGAERLIHVREGGPVRYRPLVVGNRLVLSYPSGSLRCFALPDLEPVWRVDLPAPYDPMSLVEGAPLLTGERLVTRLAARWIVVSAANGRPLGGFDGPRVALARAVVEDGVVTGTFFADGATQLCQLGVDSGEVRWTAPLTDPAPAVLTLCDGVVGLRVGRSVYAAYECDSGEQRWNLDVSELGAWQDAHGRAGPGRVAGTSLGVHGLFVLPVSARRVLGLDARTGAIAWNAEVPNPHPTCRAHDGADSLYDFAGDQLIELSTRTGALVGHPLIAEPELSGLTELGALTDAHVWGVTGLSGRVFALERATGRPAWTSERGPKVPAGFTPLIVARQLFLVDLPGNLRVFESDGDDSAG